MAGPRVCSTPRLPPSATSVSPSRKRRYASSSPHLQCVLQGRPDLLYPFAKLRNTGSIVWAHEDVKSLLGGIADVVVGCLTSFKTRGVSLIAMFSSLSVGRLPRS